MAGGCLAPPQRIGAIWTQSHDTLRYSEAHSPLNCVTLVSETEPLTPLDPDLNRHFRALFDAHDEAIRALRAANAEMGHAIQSHDEAIQAALEANRAAIDLLERLSNNGAQR